MSKDPIFLDVLYSPSCFIEAPEVHYRAKIEGALHIELDEHDPMKCTDEIIIKAIMRYKNRGQELEIPARTAKGVHGFSHEYIKYMLGGSFRGGYEPLNDNIINGRIRGVAGVVGCTNPRPSNSLYSVISASVFGRDARKMIFVPSGEKKAPPS